MYMPCMVYTSAIHLAWQREENAGSISSKSACVLQSTRADLAQLEHTSPDPAAQIITVILDVVTDKKHLHLARDSNASRVHSASGAPRGHTYHPWMPRE